MTQPTVRILLCLTTCSLFVAAGTQSTPRLTPQRIAAITSGNSASQPTRIRVKIDGFKNVSPITRTKFYGPSDTNISKLDSLTVGLRTDGQHGLMELYRELRFPTKFEPPQGSSKPGSIALTPTIPTEFKTVTPGWIIELSATKENGLIALAGTANYAEAELVNGGYGAVSGPIYDEHGHLLSPNVVSEAKVQTTTTHFHVFAVPGETYEIVLYRGDKAEKHRLTVTAD